MVTNKIHKLINKKYMKDKQTIEKEIFHLQENYQNLNSKLVETQSVFKQKNKENSEKAEKQIQIYRNELNQQNLLVEQYYENEDLLKQIGEFQSYLLKEFFHKEKHLRSIANYIENQEHRIKNYITKNNLSLKIDCVFLSYVCNKLSQDYARLNSGAKAEAATERVVATFDHKVKRLSNNRITAYNTQDKKKISAENDMIIICEKGIFTLEIKNSSRNLLVTSSGDLVYENSKDDKERLNIAEQCLLHVNITQRVIEEEFKKRYPNKKYEEVEVVPLIIIANNSIQVKDNFKRFPILLKNEIQEYIFNHHKTKNKLSKNEINLYFDILKARDEGPAKFPFMYDMNKFYNHLAAFIWIQKQINLSNTDTFSNSSEKKNIKLLTQKLNHEKQNINLLSKRLDEFDHKINKIDEFFNNTHIFKNLFIQSNKDIIKSKAFRLTFGIFIILYIAINLTHNIVQNVSGNISRQRDELLKSEYLIAPVSLEELKEINNELEENLYKEQQHQISLNERLSLLQADKFMFTPGSVWTGIGTISGSEVSVKLTVEDLRVIYHINDSISFSLIKQQIDEENGFINLKAMEWIEPDSGYEMVDLVGLINKNEMFLLVRNNNENIGELKFFIEL